MEPIERIVAALLALGPDASANIVALTGACAASLGADAAVYFRKDGERFFAVARAGLPADFPAVVDCETAPCRELRAAPTVVHRGASSFAPFAAHAALPVLLDGAERGVLAALYKEAPRHDPAADRLLAMLVASLAQEERRLDAEKEKARLTESLRQSMRMEAVGLLVGGVAHDFNNSLTNICGNAELMLKRADMPPAAREEAAEISKAGRYAAALTRQLLAFSRKTPVEPVVFDLDAVVGDLHKLLKRTMGERVAVEVTAGCERTKVRADIGQIEQVVMNLAVNARDAMPDGGRLAIRTEVLDAVPRSAPPTVWGKTHRWVVLTVADTGHGMTAPVRARLFEPFFTTKDAGRGTGLGLATVQGIVMSSGGAVTVESEPGKGAEFRVWLPAVEAASDEPAAAAAPEGAPLEGRRVLLVEDEAPVRTLLGRILRNAGLEVEEAPSGDAAAARPAGAAVPDLLITDIVMPGISGYELARRLREKAPSLPIVFISGYADEGTLSAACTASRAAVLMKPFTPSELLRRVRTALNSR